MRRVPPAAASTSAERRSRPSSSTPETRCSARLAAPPRPRAALRTSPPRWPRACERPQIREAIDPGSLTGIGVGSPGDADEETGVVANAQEPAGLGRRLPPRREPLEGPRSPGQGRQRRPGRGRGRVPPGRRQAVQEHSRRLWGTGVGGGLVLDGKPWIGRGAAGEIGHMVVSRGRRALPLRATRAAWRPTPGGPRWRRRPGKVHEDGDEDRPVQDHGAPRARPADERRLGARDRAR